MALASAQALVPELAALPHAAAVARRVLMTAVAAAKAKDPKLGAHGDLEAEAPLSREQAATPYGNVLEVLERGATSPEDGTVLGAFVALGLRDEKPDEARRKSLAAELVWLAAYTPCNALPALDAALGDAAAPWWQSVVELIRGNTSTPSAPPPAEKLVVATALRASPSPRAGELADELAQSAADPFVRLALERGSADATQPLHGELTWRPRGAVVTALLAFTGVLLVRGIAYAIARFAFGYRRPTELRITERGLELSHRVELLGRVLRDRNVIVPLDNLATVCREVRYARLGLYGGLGALVAGTYLGVGLMADGLRVPGGSPSLLGLGLLLVAIGLALDFVLSTLLDPVRRTVRLIILPRRGAGFCVRGVDAARADATLERLLSDQAQAGA
jgi:hypothetical protein